MFFKKHKKPPTIAEQSRRHAAPQVQRSVVVFSYHANRAPRPGAARRDVQASAARQRPVAPSGAWLGRVPQFLAIAAVSAVLLLSLRLDSNVNIVPVGDDKGQVFLRPLEEYEMAAAEEFASFANGNKLTVNTDAIATSLRSQFPELNAVSVSLPLAGSQPMVYVQPAVPRLILATANDGLFVLDSSGRALVPANQVTALDKLELPVVNDQSGLKVSTGKVALPQSTVTFVHEVMHQLADKGIVPSSLTLPAGVGELQLRMPGVGYYVKFNVYGNAREEVGAFLALKAQLERENRAPREYVDVRVDGRAYYK